MRCSFSMHGGAFNLAGTGGTLAPTDSHPCHAMFSSEPPPPPHTHTHKVCGTGFRMSATVVGDGERVGRV